jgi:flagellar operon protein
MTDVQHNPALLPPGAVGPAARPPAPARPAGPGAPAGPAFADVLARETAGVRFSQHALQRVERRGIDLAGGTLERLEGGVERAAAKGARDAVVLVDGTAFVVSVRNRTVITAVDSEHMREHVFTNIDSAVIA